MNSRNNFKIENAESNHSDPLRNSAFSRESKKGVLLAIGVMSVIALGLRALAPAQVNGDLNALGPNAETYDHTKATAPFPFRGTYQGENSAGLNISTEKLSTKRLSSEELPK